ncbi:DUF4912 domain-containing protein [Paenibacillus solisilvae]|uniref:DUF4912 domain-containing protein n=1 Tax=Paenibacillus solisilvae TaxID=2486751 RepID=A0ABW0VRY8_9BACL
MDITMILRLLETGKTQKEIAEQLGMPVSRLRYQLSKQKNITASATSAGDSSLEDYTTIQETYGTDRLFTLPRDPQSLYLYWELTSERKRMVEEHFHCGWTELPKILRVYDVSFHYFEGNNFNRYWDFSINQEASNWFVKGIAPDCSYIIDYGVQTIDGRFITILRSNSVKTPPKEERYHGEYRWTRMEVTPNEVIPMSEWQSLLSDWGLSEAIMEKAEGGF